MSSLLILLALLSVATLAARRGAVADVIGGASAPLLVATGLLVGPAGLSFITPGAIANLGAALDVGIVWVAFLIGVRVASSDAPHSPMSIIEPASSVPPTPAEPSTSHAHAHSHASAAPPLDAARALAALSAALVAGLLFAIVRGADALGIAVFADDARIALLLPLALGLAAVRMVAFSSAPVDAPVDAPVVAPVDNAPVDARVDARVDTPVDAPAADAPIDAAVDNDVAPRHVVAAADAGTNLRAYARSIELLALGAAVGALAFDDARMSVVVIGLGLFAASLVFLLARQGAIPPAAAVLGALLLLTGLARLALVPPAVAALIAGAAFTLARGADAVLRPLGATERPVRIVVLVLLAASIDLDVAPAAAGAIIGVAIAALHGSVALILARQAWSAARRRQRFPAASITPLLIIASFTVVAIEGTRTLLSIAVIAYAVRDALVFALSWVRPAASRTGRRARRERAS